MTIDELSDRVRALEALNRTLIRYLLRNDAIERDDLESMMDSMIDQATGDRAATFQAERLKAEIEGDTDTERDWLRSEQKALYGYSIPVL